MSELVSAWVKEWMSECVSGHWSELESVWVIAVCVHESVPKRVKVFISVPKEPVCVWVSCWMYWKAPLYDEFSDVVKWVRAYISERVSDQVRKFEWARECRWVSEWVFEQRSERVSAWVITVWAYESVHKRVKVFMSVPKEPVCVWVSCWMH